MAQSSTPSADTDHSQLAASRVGEVGGFDSPSHDSGRKRPLRAVGWVFFFLSMLSLFTLTKIPEDKIIGWVQSYASSYLAAQGATLSIGEGSLSLLRGGALVLKEVRVQVAGASTPIKYDRVMVSPSWLSLLSARLGVKVVLEQGEGELVARAAMRGANDAQLKAELKKFNLVKAGVLDLMMSGTPSPQLNLELTGDTEMTGKLVEPSSLVGRGELAFANGTVPAQAFMGFQIPKIAISEGKFRWEFQGGKLLLKEARLGKAGAAGATPSAKAPGDDITLNATGDSSLAKTWRESQLNIQVAFGFSQTVTQAFSLLDAFLGAGKQSDGSYKYQLTGPISQPAFLPVSSPAK